MESKKEELVRLFAEAMESSLTDQEKIDIMDHLYEVMEIFYGALKA